MALIPWPAAAAATASVLTGAAVVVTRYVIEAVDPLPLALMRYGLAVVCLLVPMCVVTRSGLAAKDRLAVLGLGMVFFGVFTYCFNAGLQTVPSARAGTIVAVMPALTLALAASVGIEALTWTKTAGVLVAMAGVAIVLGDWQGDVPIAAGVTPGDLWLLGAAVCGAVYNVGSRRILGRADSITVAFWSMSGGVALLVVLSGVRGDWVNPLSLDSGALAAVVFLGTAAGAVGFTLWIWALSRSTPTRVAVFFTLNPVSAAVLGLVVLSEPITVPVLVGMVTVLAGIVLTTLGSPGEPALAPQPMQDDTRIDD